MILNRLSRDITYTPDGDLLISNTGDVNISGMENMQLLCEAIQKRLSSDAGDWGSNIAIPSNLSSILGLELTKTNIGIVRAQILQTLTEYDLVDPELIFLSPPVVDGSQIIFTLNIRSESENETTGMYFVYDTRENSFQAKVITRD